MKLNNTIYDSKTISKSAAIDLSNSINTKWLDRLWYPLCLAVLLLFAIVLIEYRYPYFFLQDDNRSYYLPYFIHNYESFINGEVALYNFHQFLGMPLFAIGQTAVLYPIIYLSIFFSNLIFGHYFAAVEIIVIIHLIIGSIGLYRFVRFLDVDRKAAFFGGLTYSLSSFIIYTSNSWIIVSTAAAYFPWMLLFSLRLYKTPSLKTTFYAIAVRLTLFLFGHIQYFVYSVIFEFITAILFIIYDSLPGEKRSNIFKFLKNYIIVYFCVFILALPLLLPMWHLMTISAYRNKPLEFVEFLCRYFHIWALFRSLISPFTKIDEFSNEWLINLGHLFHIGYITLFILTIGIIKKLTEKSKEVKIALKYVTVFAIPMLLSFLWSTCPIFNIFFYIIPVLNRFRWPFKIALYLDFYLIVIATLFLSHFIAQTVTKKTMGKIAIFMLVTIQLFNFLLLYTATPYKDFGEHHADKLPLEEKFQDKLSEGRIISVGFDDIWSGTPLNNADYLTAPALGFNYATLWGLNHFTGYEQLVPAANLNASLNNSLEVGMTAIVKSDVDIPVDYLRKAAVRWYIVPRNKTDEYIQKFNPYGIVKRYEDENRAVFYDAKAYPMVFDSSGMAVESQEYQVTTNSIRLSVDFQQPDIIIFNNLYNPFFKGFIDGKKTELIPVNDIHFSIAVPKGKHNIVVKYMDPYLLAGTYIASGFLCIAAGIWIIRMLLKKKSDIGIQINK